MPIHTAFALALAFIVALAPPAIARAQGSDGRVAGTVTDSATGLGIPGVQVTIAGTTRSDVTNDSGTFAIPNLRPGTYTVSFRRVGYKPVSREDVVVSTGTTTTVDAALGVALLRLQSMVVTATTDPIEGAKSPFSVGRVGSEDIKSVPTTNSAAAAIQGKVAGVTIIRGSGRPGEGVSVQLRAPLNIRKSNSPMFVVDGVILGSTFGGTTVDLQALDIENVEVIKGASAAALYGSRAANGVISITTSRGSDLSEGTTRISTRSEFGQAFAPTNIDVSEHHHFQVNAEGQFVDNTGAATTERSRRVIDDDGFVDNAYPGQTFDNIESFFRPAEFQTHSLNISQMLASTNFLVSVNQRDEGGTLAGDRGFVQRSMRVNLDHRVRDELSFRISGFHSRANQASSVNAFRTLLSYDPDVNLGATDAEGRFLQAPDPTVPIENPLWSIQNENLGDDQRSRTLGSIDGRYSPFSWFTLSTNLSYDRSDLNDNRYTPKGTPASVTTDVVSAGRLEYETETTDALNGSISATAMGVFRDLTARFTASAIAEREKNLFYEVIGTNFFTNDTPDISNASDVAGSSQLVEIRSNGYSGNLGLDYAGKYILDGVLRRDGSSLFGPTARWNTYGRGAFAYRMGEEPWWPLPSVTEFKLRYAIGTAGTRPSFADQYETWTVAGSGGAITKVTLGNRFLKPAVTTEQEFGFETILNDRYSLEVNYILARTEDQVADVVLPAVIGYAEQWQNTGTTEGRIIEATLQAQWISRPDFSWSSTFVADRSRDRILSWNSACDPGTLNYVCPGYSLADMYGHRFVRSLGRLPERFRGAEDQFQVNDEGFLVPVGGAGWQEVSNFGTSVTVNGVDLPWGVPILEENADGSRAIMILGNGHPDAQVGWLNNLNWKGLRLHTQLHAQIGGEVYNNTKQRMYQDFRHGDLDQTGKPTELKKPFSYYFRLYNQNDVTEHFVEDGSYLKLRELALSYRFSNAQLGRVGLGRWAPEGITVGVIGRNLWTITGYTGWDPEVGSAITRYDSFDYPPPRMITGSLEITF